MNTVYAAFPQGLNKALTFSYDDDTPDANKRLIDLFNRFQVHATFHLNSLYLPQNQNESLRSLFRGHEIASHTLSHPTLTRCPKGQVIHEMIEDRIRLEDIAGYPVRGFSYPNRGNSEEIVNALKSCGIRYARMGEVTGDFSLPDDYYHWKGTCHHTEGLMEAGQRFTELHTKEKLFLCYVWGHSFEFDRDNNWELMERFLQLTAMKSDTWYCTNIRFIDYMDAWNALQFAADNHFVYNPTATECWFIVNKEKIYSVKPGETVEIV